jgi:Uma2 family endonuclease
MTQQTTFKSAPTSQYHLTYRDLDTLPDYIRRYELWEGELIMSPAPSIEHQVLVTKLLQILTLHDPQFERGIYVPAPVDVVLRENITVQPDIVYLSRAKMDLIREGRVFGAPDLCIEVLSPSTSAYDLSRKRRYYQGAGVREYWLVDPVERTLTIHGLVAGSKTEYGVGRAAISTLPEFEGLEVDLARGGGDVLERGARGEMIPDPGEIAQLAGPVHHDHVAVRPQAIDDEVVQDAALVVQEEAVTALARGQGVQVLGHYAVQGVLGASALEQELAHVADVEDAGPGAGLGMLGHDALVLHGHVETGEGGHLGLVGAVPGRERRCPKLFHGNRSSLVQDAAASGPTSLRCLRMDWNSSHRPTRRP